MMGRSWVGQALAVAVALGAAGSGGATGAEFWWPEQWTEVPPVQAEDGAAWNDLTRSPLAAVVRLGGCSGALVSPAGLVLTAQHCLDGLPELEGLEMGYLADGDGFPLPSLPPVTRTLAIDAVDDPAGACDDVAGQRCRVVPFHAGAEHRRIVEEELGNPRLIYLPDRRLARFGGSADDFSWPRHAADVALLRVVVPSPAAHVTVSDEGSSEDDAVVVIGYPVRSRRFLRAVELADEADWTLPERIRRYQAKRELVSTLPVGATAAGLTLIERLDRQLLADRVRLEAMQAEGVVALRREREEALRAWLESDQTLSGDFLDDLESLDQSEVLARMHRQRDALYGELREFAVLLDVAMRLYRHALGERVDDHLAMDLERMAVEPSLDRALFRHHVSAYATLPASRRIGALDQALGLVGDDPDLTGLDLRIGALYDGSRLDRPAERASWLGRPAEAFGSADDAFIQLAVALAPAERTLRSRRQAQARQVAALRARYGLALSLFHQASGTPLADDANASLRIGSGRIAGYSPRDGVAYLPFTHLDGLRQRALGESLDPRVIDALPGSLPVNGLSTAAVLPGHSGAPVLSRDGRLIGVIFDSNRSALHADRWSGPKDARAIHVDVRLLVALLRARPEAEAVLRELGLGPGQATR